MEPIQFEVKPSQFGKNELNQVIHSFLQTERVDIEIEFKEPLQLSKSEVLSTFRKPRNNLLTNRGDLWTEILSYDHGKIVIEYEMSDDEKTYKIYRIYMVR